MPQSTDEETAHCLDLFCNLGEKVDSFIAARFPDLPISEKIEKGVSAHAILRIATSDESLLSGLDLGDRQALGILFERYAKLVQRIGRRILRNESESEDLVQEVFLFIQQKCGIFDASKCSARSWIVQMAYHRAIERRRYLAQRRFYSQVELERKDAPVVGTLTIEADYSAEAVFGRNGLDRVLEALSEDQRETLRLHFFEGYTLAEVAQKLGQPLGNVRHHYYRALDKLRKQMFGNKAPVNGNHAK